MRMMQIEIPESYLRSNKECLNYVEEDSLIDGASRIYLAVMLTDEIIIVFEHIPENNPHTHCVIWNNPAEYRESIKDCEWITPPKEERLKGFKIFEKWQCE